MKKLCIALAVAAVTPFAMAQSAGDLVARFRVVNLDPVAKETFGGNVVTINSKVIPEVDFAYYVTPNIAAELVLTVPQKQDVLLNDAKIGTLKHLPPTLTAQYHFTGMGAFKPYLGAGVNYTIFSSVDLPAGLSIEKSSLGFAYQLGADFALSKTWSINVDYKKVQIRTDLSVGGANVGTIKVDPSLFGVGVGYKF
jgi:outer membrane protein